VRDLERWINGRSRSLKMAQFDRYYTTSYQTAIVSCTIVSAILYHFRDIWRWRVSWPWIL